MFNSEQVKILFEREAMILGTCDGVPVSRAAELFGEEAAQYAGKKRDDRHLYHNLFSLGNYDLHYLTFWGFQAAAGYANVIEIRNKALKKRSNE